MRWSSIEIGRTAFSFAKGEAGLFLIMGGLVLPGMTLALSQSLIGSGGIVHAKAIASSLETQ